MDLTTYSMADIDTPKSCALSFMPVVPRRACLGKLVLSTRHRTILSLVV